MKRDDPKTAATRKPWFAALIGFAAGVLGGAGYLLWGGEYVFNIPRLASIVCYPGLFAGFWACDHWHHSEVMAKSTGVLAVGPAYALIAGLARWICITVCRGNLSWKKLLPILPLLFVLTGCLVPRNHSALANSAQPLTRTALLPVESPFAYENKGISRDEVLCIGNRVLDTLAKGKEGNLIGPSEVASLLSSNGIPACLRWETEAGDVGTGSSAYEAARQLARRLGVSQVVRCRLHPPICSTTFGGDQLGVAFNWTGYIYADMELINLETLEVVQTSSATGQAEQYMALLQLVIPVYCGTTFGRAVDHAERTALTQLFERENPDAKKK